MLINHKKKIIFIHNPKAMGTSISKALNQIGGFSGKHKKHGKISKLGDTCEGYFIFGIVRNSYDWMVSGYFYNKERQNKQFKRFLSSKFSKDFHGWVDFVAFDEKLLIHHGQLSWFETENRKADLIINMANIEGGLRKLKNKTGLQLKLHHINKGNRKAYHSYYNEKSRKKAEKLFSKDIKRFNFKF